ncbi:hypothetical protein [Acinetobacter pittii]|uniref:hypothetical protein n=1 Tax=Acinetobacter pittii TaxID=48296 RepID=UPI0008396312|nr:hypothetical protein [Acinetobacter pittii]OCY90894.1 hypothetical protein BFR67_08505 [Acinetobacter pittii]
MKSQDQSEEIIKGDYVLATKWHDGHSQDHWFVGFFVEKEGDRYIVADSEGKSARGGGFRCCKKIHPAVGKYLIDNSHTISSIKLNLWEYIESDIHAFAKENYDYEHGNMTYD